MTVTTPDVQSITRASSTPPPAQNQRESVERELIGLMSDLIQSMREQSVRIARLEGRMVRVERGLT